MKTIIGIFVCISCLYATNLYALGDLLMTVQERAKINVMRSGQAQSVVNNASVDFSPKSESLELNGFFFKNRDKREQGVVWINGKQMTDSELGSDIALKKINEKDKTVSVMFKETTSTIPIKAGQKLMLDDGEIQDAYQ